MLIYTHTYIHAYIHYMGPGPDRGGWGLPARARARPGLGPGPGPCKVCVFACIPCFLALAPLVFQHLLPLVFPAFAPDGFLAPLYSTYNIL